MSDLLDFTIETIPGKERFYMLLRGEWIEVEGQKIALSKKGEAPTAYFYTAIIPSKSGLLERFALVSSISGTIISKSALYPPHLLEIIRENEFIFDAFERLLERCEYDLKKLIAIETDLLTFITLDYGVPNKNIDKI